MRVFPLSNWTEIDIWRYIELRHIPLPELYFSREREVIERAGMLYAVNDFTPARNGERLDRRRVRYRTVGDANLTACVPSEAATVAADHPGGRDHAADRAWGYSWRRPGQRHGDGRPEERRLLLSTADLTRIATAGSVDEGKSTLIGRLLYDSKSLFTDQLEAVQATSRRRGDDYTDLALLTDGLRAEREQGITIDVAYRYFSTPRRKFILADTPGHIQYTRNMVTGMSMADIALIVVDARRGVSVQCRRHSFLTTLLGVPHLVVCVNKMDLVDWSEEVFQEVREEFTEFAARLRVADLTFIPISALHGDNVVEPQQQHAVVRGRTAAQSAGEPARRQRPQSHRRPVSGAVCDPPAVQRASGLPWLRRTRRQRADPCR